MIRFNAFVQTDENNLEQVILLAKQLVEKSRQDVGCIHYDFFESTTNPTTLMFCETWADQHAIDLHASSAHFVKLVGEIEKIATMKLEKFIF
ncbi:MAG: putative quinol monooxygenase [Prevotella sp.]